MTSVSVPRTSTSSPARSRALPAVAHQRLHALEWFGGGAAIAFVVSFVGADLLELHHDLYLLVYFTIVGTFLASFFAHTKRHLMPMFRTHIAWSLALGAVVAFGLARTVASDPSTAHPSGAFYVFELAWRGLTYGTVDALALFVFLIGQRRDLVDLVRRAEPVEEVEERHPRPQGRRVRHEREVLRLLYRRR